MSHWINQFLENEMVNGTDKTDKPINEGPLSVLSVHLPGLLDENLEKAENNPETGTDHTDRFKLRANMSPHEGGLLSALSVPLKGPFPETSCYTLDATSLHDEYEERLAIAEYDGLQNSCQAERIAYLDAFMAVLAILPYEDMQGDWLDHRIKATQEWLSDQGFIQPK